MRYGWRQGPGTGVGAGSAMAWGLVALVAGLVGLLIPAVLVVLAVALACWALLSARSA